MHFSGRNLHAQNLVPNPGFELVSTCSVNNYFQAYSAVEDWFAFNYPQPSPDVFNTCFSAPGHQVPNTFAGISNAKSGNGMVGVAAVISDSYREVISVALTHNLIKDSAYCVSFWVKNSKTNNVNYWCKNVGGYFSESPIGENQFIMPADVISSEILDKDEWIEISDYYIAKGDEKFLNIGYFGPELIYHIPPSADGLLYYFLDDISVTLCNKDSLLSVVCELPNVLTPNKDDYNDLYVLKLNNIKKLDLQILNRWGNVVRTYDGIKEVWDGTDQSGTPLTDGIYYVKAIGETTFGEIISKQQFVHLIREY